MCVCVPVRLVYMLPFLKDFVAGRFGDLQATISVKGEEAKRYILWCSELGVCDL